MTTRTLAKRTYYDRTTHDYAMELDGEIVGYAGTKDEAETELSKLVVNILEHERTVASEPESYPGEDDGCPPDCPDGCPDHGRQVPSRTVRIRLPRLFEHCITVRADSNAEFIQHTEYPDGQAYYSLVVDGQHHYLILVKHTIGRAECIESMQQALAMVKNAIAELNRFVPLEYDPDYEELSRGEDSLYPHLDDHAAHASDADEPEQEMLFKFEDADPACDLCGAPAEFDGPTGAMLCDDHLHSVIALEIEADQPIPYYVSHCLVCDGNHHGWQCPFIAKWLHAPTNQLQAVKTLFAAASYATQGA